jgi:hypothetical protein
MTVTEDRERLTEEITTLVKDFEQKTDKIISRIDINHLFDDATKQKMTKINLVLSLA